MQLGRTRAPATGDAASDRMFAFVFVRDGGEVLVRHAYRALSAHVRVDLTTEPAPRTTTHGWTDNPHSMDEAPRHEARHLIPKGSTRSRQTQWYR